jgi:hypothetical protein
MAKTTEAIVGSKGGAGVAQRIISLMPSHELYIEAFAGLAAVGRLKRPADCDIFVERELCRMSSYCRSVAAVIVGLVSINIA